MELWVRSQDKEMLKRINTALYLKQGLSNFAKGEVIFIVGGGDELGEYETKERPKIYIPIDHRYIGMTQKERNDINE